MGVSHSIAVRNDLANLVCGGTTPTFSAGTGQILKLYSGTPPTNASTALSGNAVVSTVTALSWGAASGGVASLTSSTADSSAVGGTATFWRIFKSDASTVIDQGLCGTSSSDLNLNSTTIAAGANVSMTSGSYTAPN